jgi:hypothetical protein
LLLKQNWKQFSEKRDTQPQMLSDTLNNVKLSDGQEETSLQQLIADSAFILFRFPPHTCACLESEFADGLKRVAKDLGESRIFAVIAAENEKELFFFRERNKLTCPVYFTAATDTVFALFDKAQTPYACVVNPDMSAHNIISVNFDNINKLIEYAKETFR